MTPGEQLTYWTGWDPRGGAAAPSDGVEAFEQGRAADGEDRFELLAVAARGFRPPRFLTILEGDRHDKEADEATDASFRQTWSLVYRRIVETAPKKVVPHAIYLLGVNPPEGATDDELETFNDFYTNVHLVEVAERRHALRAVRFELVRELKVPYLGAPRYLATYEVDESGASNRRHSGPPYSSGPDVWQRHKTPWRLWYRSLTT